MGYFPAYYDDAGAFVAPQYYEDFAPSSFSPVVDAAPVAYDDAKNKPYRTPPIYEDAGAEQYVPRQDYAPPSSGDDGVFADTGTAAGTGGVSVYTPTNVQTLGGGGSAQPKTVIITKAAQNGAQATTTATPPTADDDELLFGYPQNTVLIVGGVAAGGLLLWMMSGK